MKTHSKALVALSLALLLALASCSAVKDGIEQTQRGSIEAGSWSSDGKTFTNTWSNIKFTMPDGDYTIATQEQIDALMDAGMEAAGQTGTIADITKMRMVYDFVVSGGGTGIPQIQLAYENVGINPAMNGKNENDYINLLETTQFDALAAQGLNYTEVERGTASLSGVNWVKVQYSLNDVATIDYYLHLADGYMWQIVLTYTPDTESQAADLLAGFSAAG